MTESYFEILQRADGEVLRWFGHAGMGMLLEFWFLTCTFTILLYFG